MLDPVKWWKSGLAQDKEWLAWLVELVTREMGP